MFFDSKQLTCTGERHPLEVQQHRQLTDMWLDQKHTVVLSRFPPIVELQPLLPN